MIAVMKDSNRSVALMLPVAAGVALVAGRLLPHEANFTPTLAIALWVGAYAGRQVSLATIGLSMLVTDWIIGFHAVMPAVYAAILVSVLIGRRIIGSSAGLSRGIRVSGAVGLAAVLFFVITNAACWALWYPRTVDGLMTCYVNAVPFFRATALSTAVYAGGMFAVSAWLPMLGTIVRQAPSPSDSGTPKQSMA